MKATSIDMSIATGTLRAIGDMYGPIIPVIKNIGRKLTMTASVALISGGRISATASRTIRRLAFFFSWKCLAIFSTSTIGSSTSRPKANISANRVTRLMVNPKSRFTNRVRPKTTGTAIATMRASRHPMPTVSNSTTMRIAMPRASISSLTFSSAVNPLFRVMFRSTSPGRTSRLSFSAASMTDRETETALAPFCFEIAIVIEGRDAEEWFAE